VISALPSLPMIHLSTSPAAKTAAPAVKLTPDPVLAEGVPEVVVGSAKR